MCGQMQVPDALASAHLAQAEHATSHGDACAAVESALAAVARAQQIDCAHGPTLVQLAEAHAAAAKCAAADGRSTAAQVSSHRQRCRAAYADALHKPKKLGSCSERCTIRYNFACALCACGEEAEALAMLKAVAAQHPMALRESANDPDLQFVDGALAAQLRSLCAEAEAACQQQYHSLQVTSAAVAWLGTTLASS